jgi:hypothetical protein
MAQRYGNLALVLFDARKILFEPVHGRPLPDQSLMITLLTESVPEVSQLWKIQGSSEVFAIVLPVFVRSSAGFCWFLLGRRWSGVLGSLPSLVQQNVMRDGLVGRPLRLHETF